ncbi:hypothetical protein A3B18_02950 [Candidatus Giovannonibacteria bacterium RIFCSPLOWO2_01_FULL_46_13]|uniref:Uncharacterized protein n=1 Tax=Candidatus Giovannonibacteria bacterium RIFCSPLOWO2_01_FULL_46_13 TaxID=1798352 RepID=A0A1F5X311_9BACT|nr:MAG: hypothetical protein A3B18_02950 [Candidatus Giovannonibacteria bacterium RIFCSPLOWO2_01_FULL_46_13]
MNCALLVPSHGAPTSDSELLPCLLKEGHEGSKHLARLGPGAYILWEQDFECDCEEENCDSFIYQEITESEAQKLLA